MQRRSRWLVGVGLVALAFALPFLIVRLTRHPSNDREWHPAQRVLPRVSVRGDSVEIRRLRDFAWQSESSFEVRYLDRTYDLLELDSAWYAVSRFGGVPGLAHAFLTFGFGDEYVAVSVEARKEEGETYSPLRGLLREYELAYVIGTERDIIGLRTEIWREELSLYPVRASQESIRRTFLDMVTRAEQLALEPEFYNTFTSSCSSNIVRHVNTIAPNHVHAAARLRTTLPGYSDRVAHELGLIDSELPFDSLRETFRVKATTHRHLPRDDYSAAIRQNLPPRGTAR